MRKLWIKFLLWNLGACLEHGTRDRKTCEKCLARERVRYDETSAYREKYLDELLEKLGA